MTTALALLAAAPAVPYDKAGRYVAAAFIVVFAVLLVYVAIMATKLQRLERDLSDLNAALAERQRVDAARREDAAPRDEAPLAPSGQESP